MANLPQRPDELLAVVDGDDREIGAERRDIVHARGMLHRAVHVVIHDQAGKRLLIQQRSALKDTFPLHWECVGGHLGPGEAYRDAAEREVMEELGVAGSGFERLGKVVAAEVTGWEFLEIYRATISEEPRPEPSEVIGVEWVTVGRLREEVMSGTRLFSPTFLHSLRHVRIIEG